MGGASQLASAGINLALAQQSKKKADKAANRDRDLGIAEINDQVAARERDQQAALRKRVASLRARAGASGLSSSGGSIDAVIRGLEEDAANETLEITNSASRRINSLRDTASEKRRRNLLNFASSLTSYGRGSRSLLR